MYIVGPILWLLTVTSLRRSYAEKPNINMKALQKHLLEYIKGEINKDKGTAIIGFKKFAEGECQPKPYKYYIKEKGCKPKLVKANLCAGKCNSLFVPNSKFTFCLRCQPITVVERQVRLKCNFYNRNITFIKTVKTVKSCACTSPCGE